MKPWDFIKTRRDDVVGLSVNDAPPASVKLGGTTLWAAEPDTLRSGLQDLEAAILQSASVHLTTVRNVLGKLVRDSLGAYELDDKLFSAVLGAVLRSGRMDSLIVASKNDKTFRVFIHGQQSDPWQRAKETALTLLKTGNILTIPDLESRIFKHRAYNTWSSASHVLAHLSYYGTVRLLDDGSARLEDFS
jgi:hypothetical protein